MNRFVRSLLSLAIDVATLTWMIYAGVWHFAIPVIAWRASIMLATLYAIFLVMRRHPDLIPTGMESHEELVANSKRLSEAVSKEMI